MAFKEFNKNTWSVFADDEISLTKQYIHMNKIRLPWPTVRIQFDTEAHMIRIVEGDNTDFRVGSNPHATGKSNYIGAQAFLNREVVPKGVYKLVEQDEKGYTFQFNRPPQRWRKQQ